MRDAGLDLFDPRATVMDSDCNLSPSNGREHEDFAFAFNDSNFSDRVLRIEIMPDSPDTRPDLEGCLTLADWATRKSKRRRGDIGDGEKENALDINIRPDEQTLDCQLPDIEVCVDDDNHDEEEVPMIEEFSSGH